jgi:hypothetical protein
MDKNCFGNEIGGENDAFELLVKTQESSNQCHSL